MKSFQGPGTGSIMQLELYPEAFTEFIETRLYYIQAEKLVY